MTEPNAPIPLFFWTMIGMDARKSSVLRSGTIQPTLGRQLGSEGGEGGWTGRERPVHHSRSAGRTEQRSAALF